jgi:hypothetical protein
MSTGEMDADRFLGSGLRSKESQRIIRHRLESPFSVKFCPSDKGSLEVAFGARADMMSSERILDEQPETVHSLRFSAAG